MPTYEYRCAECGIVSEFRHPISGPSTPLSCPSCGEDGMRRIVSACGFSVRDSGAARRRRDRGRERADMRQDLRENYQVTDVRPLAGSLESVYSEVKSQGSAVKEQMAQRIEASKKEKAEKERRRAEGRPQRIKKRVAVLKEKHARKQAEDRRIVL